MGDARPAGAILASAEQYRADLIVLGTHGRAGVDRFLRGSVAENVVRQARVPTFTARPKEHEFVDPVRADSAPRLQKIRCPVNFTTAAEASPRIASSLAEGFGARVTVLRIEEQQDPGDAGVAIEGLCAWIEPQAGARGETEPMVGRGNAAEQVLRDAREGQHDLIVPGGQRRPGLGAALFGTTTESIPGAPVPDLTVPLPPV